MIDISNINKSMKNPFQNRFFRKWIHVPILVDDAQLYSSIYINVLKQVPEDFEPWRNLYNHLVFIKDSKDIVVWGD